MACSSRLSIILVLFLLFCIAQSVKSGKKKSREKGAAASSQSEDSENDRPKNKEKSANERTNNTDQDPSKSSINQPEWLAEQLKTVDYENLSLDPVEDTSGSPDPAIVALLDEEDDLDITPRLVVDEPEEKRVEQPKVARVTQPKVASPKKVKAGSTAEKSKAFPSKILKDPRQSRDQPIVAPPVDSPPRPPLGERILSMMEEDRRKEKLEKARVARDLSPPPPPPNKPQHLIERQKSWANRTERSQQQAANVRRTRSTTRRADLLHEERVNLIRREFGGYVPKSNTIAPILGHSDDNEDPDTAPRLVIDDGTGRKPSVSTDKTSKIPVSKNGRGESNSWCGF